ncbi:NAD-binding protein [Echinicola marina]|uniref:3-hydroxyacyl-CoA dehydrogenase family protein n=1 Tax=Echinicola marina TaxID=2859768 RepID=UPI001CF6C218|nr:3-hydroxyacyl-CoA dehydrogenase NAD-binding domain-containing protein [Echinicola marina]UCS92680.1 NAD-binding protein [Echinicola marina]
MVKVSVVGAGTMGNGIAHVFAQFGHKVALIDSSEKALEMAMGTIAQNLDRQIAKEKIDPQEKEEILSRIRTYSDLELGISKSDLVVEAATENLSVKLELFKKLDQYCPKETILASNTSSISITQIASATARPNKVIGMHFMNPVPVMPLVEVIRGYSTSHETTHQIMSLSKSLEKTPVEVNDYPGFVSNRILMPMINEAIYSLYEGVAGVQEIDTVLKMGMAHPMGPLQLADFIGLDVCLSILKVLYEGLGNPKYAPCPLLVNMVAAGHKGVKSGVGFYKHELGSKEIQVAERFQN